MLASKNPAIIFDMDGVIVDSEPLNEQHLVKFLQLLGVESPVLPRTLQGLNTRAAWTILIDHFHLDHDIEDMIPRGRKNYLDFLRDLPEIPAVPGAVELIQYLHRAGYRLAIASSANPERLELFMDAMDIGKYFGVVVSGDDAARSKPAPDIYLCAAERLGVDPTTCIAIEDSMNGIKSAKAAGMKCIAFNNAVGDEDQTDADLIIDDFAAFTSSLKAGHTSLETI